MKFIVTLFLSVVLIADVAFSSPFTPYYWFNRSLHKNPQIKCDNVSHWKDAVEKVKKEHPTSDLPKLAEFISIDLMKDPSNPLFAAAEYDIKDAKYDNDTRTIGYAEYNGNVYDFVNLFNQDINACEMGSNLSVILIYKNQQKSENFLRRYKLSAANLTTDKKHSHLTKRILNALTGPSAVTDCSKLPKMQAIIDKVNKKNITSPVEYTRLLHKQMKATITPIAHTIIYLQPLDNKVSMVSAGNGRSEDFSHACPPGTTDPRCHDCQAKKGTATLLINYLGK